MSKLYEQIKIEKGIYELDKEYLLESNVGNVKLSQIQFFNVRALTWNKVVPYILLHHIITDYHLVTYVKILIR